MTDKTIILNPKVDLYLTDGCGRCKYHATANCKVKKWQTELETLRQIVLECGLTEELKWSIPVYTFQNKNILIVCAFKDFCSLSFLKGILLKDQNKILEKQGENSQTARIIKFTEVDSIVTMIPTIKQYILEAIEIEKNGEKVVLKKSIDAIPEELENKFIEMVDFKKAFYSLTPGKQRAYIIHFSQPKQSTTRISRIENCVQKILNGEGFNDNYRKKINNI